MIIIDYNVDTIIIDEYTTIFDITISNEYFNIHLEYLFSNEQVSTSNLSTLFSEAAYLVLEQNHFFLTLSVPALDMISFAPSPLCHLIQQI